MERSKTIYIDDGNVKTISFCDSEVISFSGGVYELPYPTKPTNGNHSLETCDVCRKHHQELVKNLESKLAKFPDCCKYHKNLKKLKEFNKEDFDNFPEITANKIMFTYHHIINKIDNDDWYDDINDYVDYTLESYGSMPINYGSPLELCNYFNSVIHFLNNYNTQDYGKINQQEFEYRMEAIIKMLNSYYEKEPTSNTDLNLLLATYNKWYKIFPFDLYYFKEFKEKFGRTLPFISGKPRENKYTGIVNTKLMTKEQLSQLLIRITKSIITNINGAKLFEQGILTNTEKIELDLIIQNRKLELSEISEMDNSDKQGYIKILKKWFKTEKKFIKDITPFLKDNSVNESSNNLRPNRTDIAYYCYYMKEAKTLDIDEAFPSDSAWKKIGEKFKKNHKNIQKVYNSICNNENERLKKSKKKNIEYVIENMLTNNPEAKKLAKTELKALLQNS